MVYRIPRNPQMQRKYEEISQAERNRDRQEYRWYSVCTECSLLSRTQKEWPFIKTVGMARPYAVGRKNFLFHDTVKGARASSIIYSLVETAKLNNLNIYAYLETVLLYMPDYKNEPEGIEELMPWSNMIQQSCQIKSKS